MPKRPRNASSHGAEDEDWNGGESSSAGADSEYDDVSFRRKNASLSFTKRKARPTGRGKVLKTDASPRSFMPQDFGADVSLHPKSTHTIVSPAPIRTALLDWYKTVHSSRGMPWRKPHDPTLSPDGRAQRAYEVWISEIMLQQTQVATVIPYYNRWMEQFPTIRDLAGATIDEVNALWKGLGYYSRASRLLAGAQKAVNELGGWLPDNAKDMEAKIPGVGRYSAGAICSIAYGEQVPVLDGNVHRLLSRFLALHAPPKAKATLDILWAGARDMVEIQGTALPPNPDPGLVDSESQNTQYPGDINQALIELGSTVCKVREPDCEACPLRTWCAAYRDFTAAGERNSKSVADIEDTCLVCEPLTSYEGVTSYPMKVDRKRAREELDIVHIIEWKPPTPSGVRRFLMIRRPDTGLLAGLYDFPGSVDVLKTITLEAQHKLAAETLSKLIQGRILPGAQKVESGKGSPDSGILTLSKIISGGDVVHVFSHIRKTYRVQWIVLQGGDSPPATLDTTAPLKGRRTKKSKTEKHPANDVTTNQSDTQPGAMWVPLDEVLKINMGSGVVKVWNMAKSLWEGAVI